MRVEEIAGASARLEALIFGMGERPEQHDAETGIGIGFLALGGLAVYFGRRRAEVTTG